MWVSGYNVVLISIRQFFSNLSAEIILIKVVEPTTKHFFLSLKGKKNVGG